VLIPRADGTVTRTYGQLLTVSITLSRRPQIHSTASISFENTGSNVGDMHMYHRPFLIEIPRGSLEVYDTGEVSAALLFNLALLHHESGIKHGKSTSLKKALIVYEHGLQYLQHGANALVLTAAICNNWLNLLITHFYDIAKAKKMLNFIDSILTHIEYKFVLGCTRNASDFLYDPNTPSQSLSIQELHLFRLSLAFLKIHGFAFRTSRIDDFAAKPPLVDI
jgi:hypothetical protein